MGFKPENYLLGFEAGRSINAEKERKKGKKEKKKNNPKNSGHFVPQQRLRAAHALHSDQFYILRD